MEVSFCLEVTDLKEPLQLCYLQLQIINGSSQNNSCLVRNWKSPSRVELMMQRMGTCQWAFYSFPLTLCLWSACWWDESHAWTWADRGLRRGNYMCTSVEVWSSPLDLPCNLDQGLRSFMVSVSFFAKESLRSL